MVEATNPNAVTEEEKKEEARLEELLKKEEKNEEELKEVDTLKENRQTRYQKRINQLSWKAKDAEERYGVESERAKKLEAEIAELRAGRTISAKPVIVEETVEIRGKSYYTDTTLKSMVDAGQLTEEQAYKHQKTRDRAELLEEVKSDLSREEKEKEAINIRKEDALEVLKANPNFSKRLANGETNPDFDANDPLYKLTTEIYAEGMAANPRGFSIALKRAKQILRTGDKPIDLSEDLSVHSNTSAPDRKQESKEVKLSEYEEETAIAMYCKGDYTNEKTGRQYTKDEALAKGLAAKKAILARRNND